MARKHRYLGHMSIHHMVPRSRIADYYGTAFKIPKNRLKLWRLRHDAWHVLFGNKSLNEIIKYLKSNKPVTIYGYHETPWVILFKNKTAFQAAKLLTRVRSMKRKQYAHLEFDPEMKRKALRVVRTTKSITYVRIHYDRKFQRTGN